MISIYIDEVLNSNTELLDLVDSISPLIVTTESRGTTISYYTTGITPTYIKNSLVSDTYTVNLEVWGNTFTDVVKASVKARTLLESSTGSVEGLNVVSCRLSTGSSGVSEDGENYVYKHTYELKINY